MSASLRYRGKIGREQQKRKRRHLWEVKELWEWQKEPGSVSSVFLWVRSAGEEKIKVETPLLKLGNVEGAAAQRERGRETDREKER